MSRTPDTSHTEVMQGIGHLNARVNVLAAAIKDLVIAETLATETFVLDVNGQATRQFAFAYAAVAVTSLSTQVVTVSSSPPQGTAPGSGPGVALVPPNKGAVHCMSGHVVTLYGNPGDRVTLSVFARPQPPAWG